MSPLDIALRLEEQDMDMYDEDPGLYIPLYLVNRGCGSDEDKAKLLRAACEHGKLDVVKELVEQHNVDLNSEIIVAVLYTCTAYVYCMVNYSGLLHVLCAHKNVLYRCKR